MVEFSIVLPLLLLLTIGVFEFGKAFNYWIDQTHLASTGARWAVVNKNPDGTCVYPGAIQCLQRYIQQQADTKELRDGGTGSVPNKAKVCIRFPNPADPALDNPNPPQVGDPVEVKVSVVYNWLPLIGDRIGTGQTTLGGTATQRLEALPTNYAAGCYP
jgi:hypothetical protein